MFKGAFLFQDKKWIRLRKKLLQDIKQQVALYLGTPDLETEPYLKNYKDEFKGRWVPTNKAQLMEQLTKVQLIYGADFHPFPQSQRTHLRILRELIRVKKIALCVECVESRHQDVLEDFINGKIKEKVFLEKVEWQQRWGFPWEFYRPLFDLAKKEKLKVFGLNKYLLSTHVTTLYERDQHSARCIQKIRSRYPELTPYIVYGDLHLAKGHLPDAVDTLAGKAQKKVVLLQNSERLYFKALKASTDTEVNYLKKGKERFCVLSAPPWVKWQSYLMYLESNVDKELYSEDEESVLEISDHIASLIDFIGQNIEEEVNSDDIEVYTLQNQGILTYLEEELSEETFHVVSELLKREKSFYLPPNGLMFLSRLTMNHAASLAGRYVHFKVSRKRELFWNFPDDFERFLWSEAWAFFLAKLVNPKRKPENVRNMQIRMMYVKKKNLGQQVLALVLDQKLREVIFIHRQKINPLKRVYKNPYVYIEVSRVLGSLLGEKIYRAFRAGSLSIKDIQSYLKRDFSIKDFHQVYYDFITQIEEMPKVSLGVLENVKEGAGEWNG